MRVSEGKWVVFLSLSDPMYNWLEVYILFTSTPAFCLSHTHIHFLWFLSKTAHKKYILPDLAFLFPSLPHAQKLVNRSLFCFLPLFLTFRLLPGVMLKAPRPVLTPQRMKTGGNICVYVCGLTSEPCACVIAYQVTSGYDFCFLYHSQQKVHQRPLRAGSHVEYIMKRSSY